MYSCYVYDYVLPREHVEKNFVQCTCIFSGIRARVWGVGSPIHHGSNTSRFSAEFHIFCWRGKRLATPTFQDHNLSNMFCYYSTEVEYLGTLLLKLVTQLISYYIAHIKLYIVLGGGGGGGLWLGGGGGGGIPGRPPPPPPSV